MAGSANEGLESSMDEGGKGYCAYWVHEQHRNEGKSCRGMVRLIYLYCKRVSNDSGTTA